MPSTQPESACATEHPKCLARSVLEEFARDPALEAVTIDPARQKIAVATLGNADVPQITARIRDRVERVEHVEEAGAKCKLLTGGNDCQTCHDPLSQSERQRITIRQDAGVTTIARVTCPTAPKFWRWRDISWPKVVQRDVEFLEHAHEEDEWKPQLLAAALCGVFGLVAWLMRAQPQAIIFYGLAYLAGSWFTAQEVWERLRKRAIDVHFLMLAVAAGGAAIGAWAEGSALLFLFSLSGALEHFALGRTQREIRALFKQAPKVATIIDELRHEQELAVENLRPGMRLIVKPGDQFAVDAEIVKGQTAADESNLTGEAQPVEKTVGDTVLAGTMNLWGAVEATVLRSASESSLQKIIRLIKEAQHQKAPAQQFTDKFGSVYTYVVLGLSLAMFFVWWLGFNLPAFAAKTAGHSAFYRAMTLLVVASPCALVLSIPSAVLASIAWGARHGILFRGGAAVEKLASVDAVALDKTGTLTTGELRVEAVESFPAGREEEVATLAYSLERLSTHPLARAVTRYGKRQGLKIIDLEQFESATAQGLKAKWNGSPCLLGRRDWLWKSSPTVLPAADDRSRAGLSEIWLVAGDLAGRITLRDDVRPQARAVLDELEHEGVSAVVLTGDREAAAEHLRLELCLQDVRAELKPEEKVAAVRAMSEQGKRVAMIGDGVNDAPSLAAAHVGVAMGARGSDAALEQADIVLMHDRLENFLAAFRLSQRARSVIRQNLVISLGTVAVLVTLALLGIIPLTIGVVGHEGSTVVVVMNSLRLLFGPAQSTQLESR